MSLVKSYVVTVNRRIDGVSEKCAVRAYSADEAGAVFPSMWVVRVEPFEPKTRADHDPEKIEFRGPREAFPELRDDAVASGLDRVIELLEELVGAARDGRGTAQKYEREERS